MRFAVDLHLARAQVHARIGNYRVGLLGGERNVSRFIPAYRTTR
jgi:hypothetical protein